MPASRTPGMDHDHYEWSPLPSRPTLRWPGGQPVAMTPVIALEHLQDPMPDGGLVPRDLAGGMGIRPAPNYPMIAQREYGHRVGIFRIVEIFERYGVPLTVAIDAMSAERYPFLVEYLSGRNATFVAHGISLSQVISSLMTEQVETAYIAETLDRLRAAGIQPRGWLGPEYGESERTPRLLAEAGLAYTCDWLNDEQPYQMSHGDLIAMPLWCDYDDAYALVKRQMTETSYTRLLTRGVDRLMIDGATTARLIAFLVRPWLTGQPYRLNVLEEVFGHAQQAGVWFADSDTIVDAYVAQRATATG